jgi:hypothetical protein
MQTFISFCVVLSVIVLTRPLRGDLIRIPEDLSTIQAGIDQAQALDTVLVAPGVYKESLAFNGKTLILASWYLMNPDSTYISSTVLDGNDGDAVIMIDGDVGPQTAVIGFTIRNADDGIAAKGKFNLIHNRITACSDGIDYEDYSGGICRENLFEYNSDDGIDLDDYIDVIIEKNTIRYNDDDGIEIRLHDYTGTELSCLISDNSIYSNGEDGIQLIDYQELSDRTFMIDRNLIYDNAMAGLGCMSDENTEENYEGAPIGEPVYLFNNTFLGNSFAVSGGANLIALNNIFAQQSDTALKNVNGNSIVSHALFWDNALDLADCNTDSVLFYTDPLLDDAFFPLPASPCIDKGVAYFVWQDQVVLNLPPAAYQGSAPDIGAREYAEPATAVTEHEHIPGGLRLYANFPNPFNPATTIRYHVERPGRVKIDIFDIRGRIMAIPVDAFHTTGDYEINWQAEDTQGVRLPSGVYFCRLQGPSGIRIMKMTMLK